MSKRALVTGSTGFVGRHMLKALQLQGYSGVGVDISQGNDARDFFRNGTDRYDLVVHCAAVVGGRTMIDGEPLRLAVEDLTLDAEMFRWALRTRPKRIVAFSSSAAYPTFMQTQTYGASQLRERHIGPNVQTMPDATYGWVKLTLERLAAEANAEGIRTHVFRPFSGYGGDQALDYPFPAIVKRAFEHPESGGVFRVWGDPASTRDWVHIDDVVGCVLSAIDADDIGPMNICTGTPTTFSNLARLCLEHFGKYQVPIVGDHSKPMGVFNRVGDPTRMQQIYTPKISIQDGIRRAAAELAVVTR